MVCVAGHVSVCFLWTLTSVQGAAAKRPCSGAPPLQAILRSACFSAVCGMCPSPGLPHDCSWAIQAGRSGKRIVGHGVGLQLPNTPWCTATCLAVQLPNTPWCTAVLAGMGCLSWLADVGRCDVCVLCVKCVRWLQVQCLCAAVFQKQEVCCTRISSCRKAGTSAGELLRQYRQSSTAVRGILSLDKEAWRKSNAQGSGQELQWC
jgi:hypothetical protein